MRTHDGPVIADVTAEALAGHPATDVPPKKAPNVRVAPSPAPGAGPSAGPGRGPGGWDCDVAPDEDPSDGRGADAGAEVTGGHDAGAHDRGAHDGEAHEPVR